MGKARKQNVKPFKKAILIICPGITERAYINSLKLDKYKGLNIEVKPQFGKADQYRDVFETLKKEYANLETARTCFFMNDMDAIVAKDQLMEYSKQRDATLKVAKNKLKVIESMPCIEFWFILHDKYTDSFHPTYQSLEKSLRKIMPGYEKTEFWAK